MGGGGVHCKRSLYQKTAKIPLDQSCIVYLSKLYLLWPFSLKKKWIYIGCFSDNNDKAATGNPKYISKKTILFVQYKYKDKNNSLICLYYLI